jgi:hypothetical protein
MSLYDTGTVSIANGANIITGTGTNWVAVAGVKLGDLLTVDGSIFLQIYAVNSDTGLLVKTIPEGLTYTGAALTNVKYAIVRHFTNSTNADIAAAIMALQQKWHARENEMTGWYASTDNTYPITSLTGDIYEAITPIGVTALASGVQAVIDSAATTETRLVDVEDRVTIAQGSMGTIEQVIALQQTVSTQHDQVDIWHSEVNTWQSSVSSELALAITAKNEAIAAQQGAEVAEASTIAIAGGDAPNSLKLGSILAANYFHDARLPAISDVTGLQSTLDALENQINRARRLALAGI